MNSENKNITKTDEIDNIDEIEDVDMRTVCNDITTEEEMAFQCSKYHERIVKEMYEKYKKEIIVGKTPSEHPTIFIIGGQNASGKSKLIEELEKRNDNTVSIVIDNMKSLHPFNESLTQKFPDSAEKYLHEAWQIKL